MPKKEDLSSVPEAVLKQSRAAQKAMKKISDPAPDGNTDPNKPLDVNPEPVVDPAPIDPAPAEPIKPVAPAILDPDDNAWESKYKVLQGKYNSEIPALHDEIRELKKSVSEQAQLKQKIEELSKKSDKPKAEGDILERISSLDPNKFDGWGDEVQDLVKMMNRLSSVVKKQQAIIHDQGQVVGSVAQPVNSPELDNVSDRLKAVETSVQDNTIANYLTYLDKNIDGNWREINKDPNFSKWLLVEDPMTMMTRGLILTEAAENYRSAQVANIFNQYIGENKIQGKVSVAPTLPTGGGSDPVGEGLTNQPAKVSLADITKAENDYVAGRITEEEYDKISAKFQTQLGG